MSWFGRSGRLSIDDARRIWFARQGLGSRTAGSAASLLRRIGWTRSSGDSAYVSCFARIDGFSRADLDRAVFDRREIVLVPSVRGAVLLVPSDEARLSIAAARPLLMKDVERVRRRCGVDQDELDDLADAVIEALGAEARDIDDLRERLGDRVRSLGDAGSKLGDPTTLTLALRYLAASGRLRRVPAGGRVDSERVRYARLRLEEGAEKPDDETSAVAVNAALVAAYLGFAAPATEAEIRHWTGLGETEVRAALPLLELREVPVDGETCFALQGDRYVEAKPKPARTVAFLPAEDNMIALRAPLSRVLTERAGAVRAGGERVSDHRVLHAHPIVEKGAVVGFWEYDADRQEIAYSLLNRPSRSCVREAKAEAEALGAFVREQLERLDMTVHDTPRARAERVQWIRSLASTG